MLDDVVVHKRKCADTHPRQRLRDRRAKAADPDDADAQAPKDSMVLVSKRSALAVVELRVR